MHARRPDLSAQEMIGVGAEGLAERLNAYLDVGFSKFVIRPITPTDSWPKAVESVSDVLSLQS